MVLEAETKRGNLVAIILNYVHCYFELIIVIVTLVCASCGAAACNQRGYRRQCVGTVRCGFLGLSLKPVGLNKNVNVPAEGSDPILHMSADGTV